MYFPCIQCTQVIEIGLLMTSPPGEWDGAGAVVKRAIRTHQIQHPEDEMTNAQHCVDFLKSRFSHRALSPYEQSKDLPVSR